jgi:hypothetical protein
MVMTFTIPTKTGERTLTSQELAQQIGEKLGMTPIGITSDGVSGIFQAPNGIQTIPFHEVLGQYGFKIASYAPDKSIPSESATKYRAGLEGFSDPDMQMAYLQTVARKDLGIENPQIIGQGNDRFVYNPKTLQWINLTNAPGLDMSDVVGGGMALTKGAASVAGGVGGAALAGLAGAPSGPGAIAAGALGAGAGSALGQAGAEMEMAKVLGALDPNYFDVAQANQGKMLGAIGKNAALSGGIGALTGGLGAIGKGLATPISGTLSTVGRGTQAVGGATEAVGAGLGSPIGRFGMQAGLDPTGISGIGALGGFAKDIASPIAQGAVKAGDFVRSGINAARGLEGPTRSFAGETFAQTAQNLPNVGKFVRGVEALGGGLEKTGRAFETGVSGTLRGVGIGAQGIGKGAQALGRVGAAGGEQLGYQTAAQRGFRELDGANASVNEISGLPQNYIPIDAPKRRELDFARQAPQGGASGLMQAIIASGGL